MAKEKKISFLVYMSWWDALKRLPDSDKGLFLKALYEYQIEGTVPNDNSPIASIFWVVKSQLDFDIARYEEVCTKNQENGRKGGRPKKPTAFLENRTVIDLTEGLFEKPKKADIDKDIDVDKEIKKEKEKENLTPEQKRRIEEDRRWNELYNEVHSSEMYKNSSYNKQNK